MKKHIALKIVLMFVILILTCFINNDKSFAVDLNYYRVATSENYFCRDYGGPLTSLLVTYGYDSSSLYDKDKDGNYIYITSNPDNRHYDDKYAYIFNFINNPNNLISGNHAQRAFWSLVNPNTSPYSWSTYRSGYNNYIAYHNSISNYATSSYQPVIEVSENAAYNPETKKFGPIKVQYATWGSTYKLQYEVIANGRTIISKRNFSPSNNFYINFTGVSIDDVREATFRVYYNYLSKCWAKIEPLKATGSTTGGERYYCEFHKNHRKPVKDISACEAANTELIKDIWWKYNNNYYVFYDQTKYAASMNIYGIQSDGNYWIPTGEVTGIAPNIRYKYALLEPFRCAYDRRNIDSRSYMGQEHCGYIVPPRNSQKLVHVTFGKETGSTYIDRTITIDKAVITSLTLQKADADHMTTLLKNAKFKATFKNVKEFTFNRTKVKPGNESYEFTINKKFKITNVVFKNENEPIVIELTEMEVPIRDGRYYMALDGTIKIEIAHTASGLTRKCTYDGSNDVTINNNSLTTEGFTATLTIPNKIIPLVNVNPIHKYSLEDYSSTGANPDQALQGATFEIIARQKANGKYVDLDKVDNDNGSFTFKPRNLNNIFVIIREINAPKGYKKIECPINIVYNLTEDKSKWIKTFWPTESKWKDGATEWADAPFTNENYFGGWRYQKEEDSNGDAYPNPYISKKGDKIVVYKDQKTQISEIQVFDEPQIDELTLVKIDGDDGNKLIDGAKFRATFTNTKEFTYNGTKHNGNKPFEFVITNGQVKFENIVYDDIHQPITITLEEIALPTNNGYYFMFIDPIIITLNHTTKDGLTGTIRKIETPDVKLGKEKIKLLLNKIPTITDNAISYDENGKVEGIAGADNKYKAAVVMENLHVPALKIKTTRKVNIGSFTTSGPNTNETLDGAKFYMEARQKGEDGTYKILYSGECNQDTTLSINPININDVFIIIKETNAPDGYKPLEYPLNIVFNISGHRAGWKNTYCPSEKTWKDGAENWENAPFTDPNDFGDWKWDKDNDPTGNNSLPNPYYSKKSGDRIVVNNETTANIEGINVFDEAKVPKLILKKVDADSETEKLLNGAKFKATLYNVKEYKIGNNVIKNPNVTEEIVDGRLKITCEPIETGEFTIKNGKLTIYDVVYADENKPIMITLEETAVPDATNNYYFKKLEKPVTISISHTPKDGLTNGIVGELREDGTIGRYTGTETINNSNLVFNKYEATLTLPNIRLIDIDGLVWLDGTTGIKPVMEPNGVKDNTERNVSNVLVEIKGDSPRQFNNETATYINDNTTRTNNNGTYKFIGLRWNKEYFVTFNYDGIHYIASNAKDYKGAKEEAATRTTFNDGYKTINNNMGLSYEYNETANKTYGIKARTSILETLSEKNAADKKYPVEMTDTRLEMGSIQDKFNMTASTTKKLYDRHGRNLNLGILKRGTDLALSTNVYTANVSVNGQTTIFDYDLTNQENITIDLTKKDLIDSRTSDDKHPADYSNYLRSTDYNYRMRRFEYNDNFYVTDVEETDNLNTGNIDVYVTYTLQLENQANKFAKVKEIRYDYSPYYQFDTEVGRIYYLENGKEVELVKGTDYRVYSNDNRIDINKEIVFDVNSSNNDNYFGVRTLYIEFRVPDSTLDYLRNGEVTFENKAEIMEYETAEGLIDIDSQPGNYMSKSQIEDDNDKANGIRLGIKDEVRTISGFVWDDANKNGKFDEGETLVDDVIVQLIELKEKNGKNYEYIWQETLSGSKDVKRIAPQKNEEGKFVIENYSHPDGTITTGGYKFEEFIPGDYIIRFIYGDGTTYDLTDNMIKYNGQDYKSTIESKYTSEWYNNAKYEANVNITRDNEARRLETMSWSTNIDARKGILLKLLDGYTQEDFNLVEKEELFNALKDFKKELDDKLTNAKEDGNDDLEKEITEKLSKLENIGGIPDSYKNLTTDAIKYLLKNVTLDNTWMCAETAKIKVPVESEDLEGVTTTVEVDGIVTKYKYDFSSMAFGLAKRPETKLKVEKHLKEMVLKASNGQTVLSAYINDKNELDGQIDGLQVITIPEGMPGQGEWIFSVSPVDINTILDGGRLEFSYNIVVKNIGDEDYLGATLRGEYNDANINYEEKLKEHAKDVKTAIKSANTTHTLGTYLGQTYYMGGTDSANKVQTEVTGIRDYIANELVVFENGTKNLENIGEIDHYLYNDNYAITEKTKINNVLENQIPTGKLEPNNQYDEYVVNLGKDPLSSTSTLDFFNYIAEITSFSNAVGRRGTYTTVDEDGKLIGKSITPGNAEAVNKHIPDNGARLEPDESTVEEVHIQSALGQDKQTTYVWLGIATISIAIIGAGVYVIKRRIMK